MSTTTNIFMTATPESVMTATPESIKKALLDVLDVHLPTRIYKHCGHTHTEDDIYENNAIKVRGVGIVCEYGYVNTVCSQCCHGTNRYQTEYCAAIHDHSNGYLCWTNCTIFEALNVTS
ncbi:MAG: hypothetical protein ACREQ5_00685 [Candidatus Dormibacteria bacterium]